MEEKRKIAVIFETTKGSCAWGSKKYLFYCDSPRIKVGDVIESLDYNNRMRVVDIDVKSDRTDLKTLSIDNIYVEAINRVLNDIKEKILSEILALRKKMKNDISENNSIQRRRYF